MSKYSHVPVDRQQIFCDIEITLSCNKLKTTVLCYQIGPTEYGERSVRPNSCRCRLCFALTEKLVQIYSDTAHQNMTRPLVNMQIIFHALYSAETPFQIARLMFVTGAVTFSIGL